MFLDELQKRVQDMQTRAGVRAVFGEVMELDGRKVIPVASVRYAFGMGGGQGPTRDKDREAPAGGGGGGGVQIDPIALIEVSNGKLNIRPIVNVTRVVIVSMVVSAWMTFWIARAVRKAAAPKPHTESPRQNVR